MPAELKGFIYTDVKVDMRYHSDEVQIVADKDDIAEIMEANNIEAGEMIQYLKEGPYELRRQDVIDWLEQESVVTISTIASVCIQLLESEYKLAEEGRVEYRNTLSSLRIEHGLSG
jgi:hypothetical protein